MAHKNAVHKYGGTIWLYIQLDFGGYTREGNPGIFLHFHGDGLLGSRTDGKLLLEIQISALAHGDLVLAGEEQQFFRPFQFLQVSDVLTVEPDTRSFFNLRGSDEFDLPQNLIV